MRKHFSRDSEIWNVMNVHFYLVQSSLKEFSNYIGKKNTQRRRLNKKLFDRFTIKHLCVLMAKFKAPTHVINKIAKIQTIKLLFSSPTEDLTDTFHLIFSKDLLLKCNPFSFFFFIVCYLSPCKRSSPQFLLLFYFEASIYLCFTALSSLHAQRKREKKKKRASCGWNSSIFTQACFSSWTF